MKIIPSSILIRHRVTDFAQYWNSHSDERLSKCFAQRGNLFDKSNKEHEKVIVLSKPKSPFLHSTPAYKGLR